MIKMNSLKEKQITRGSVHQPEIKIMTNQSERNTLNQNNIQRTNLQFSGLANLGNTCYMNAILQCLFNTEELTCFFKEIDSLNLTRKETQLIYQYFKLIESYSEKQDKEYLVPSDFRDLFKKRNDQFDNNNQHDSHEFLTILLDTFRNEITDLVNISPRLSLNGKFYLELTEFYDKLFYGKLNSSIKCENCREINSSEDKFSSLGLSIPLEYKIFIYFIPLKAKRNYKMFIKITDNMIFSTILEKISLIIGNKVESASFYLVLNDQLKQIIDINEKVVNYFNRDSFIFVMEADFEVIHRKSYFSMNYLTYDEENFGFDYKTIDCLNRLKTRTFPRLFSFKNAEKIKNIFESIINYSSNFIQKDDFLVFTKSFFNQNNERYECLWCSNVKSGFFYCGCIKELRFGLISTLSKQLLNKSINEENTLIEIYIVLKKSCLNFQDLNKCIDFTSKPVPEVKLDLYDLMTIFTEEEKLEDKIFCNSCLEPKTSTKRIEYCQFPDIFIVNFKRFKFSQSPKTRKSDKNYSTSEKNCFKIDFPIQNLDLSRFAKDGRRYELFSVCYHEGSINSGHYTSVCKIGKKWFEFNDKISREFSEDRIVNQNAYILFYRESR